MSMSISFHANYSTNFKVDYAVRFNEYTDTNYGVVNLDVDGGSLSIFLNKDTAMQLEAAIKALNFDLAHDKVTTD